MKTIKQIADELGVSKQAVFYRIKKPPLSNTLQPFISKLDGILTVSLDGEVFIKQAFALHEASKEPPKLDDKGDRHFDAIIAMLQSELDAKNEQLAAKDRQLEAAQAALRTEQMLHANTKGIPLIGGEDPARPDAPPMTLREALKMWRRQTH